MVDSSLLPVSAISDAVVARPASVAPVSASVSAPPAPASPPGEAPGISPAAISSPRSLDGLAQLSEPAPHQLSPAEMRQMPPARLGDISIVELSLSQVAGLSWAELKALLPTTG